MISGLKIIENALSDGDEMGLLKNIWHDMPTRTVQHSKGGRTNFLRYGWSYDTPHKWIKDMPKWLHSLANVFSSDSVTVNHYLPGSGIYPHKDSMDFADNIRILNLGAGVNMVFTKVGSEEEIHIPRRSMTVLGGESRYDWEHGIVDTKEERWSIVFRKLNKEFYAHNTKEKQ